MYIEPGAFILYILLISKNLMKYYGCRRIYHTEENFNIVYLPASELCINNYKIY